MLRTSALIAVVLAAGVASAGEWPDLSVPPRATGGGAQDAAVIVAIEDYTFLADIPGARTNARDWREWMKKTRGVRTVRVLEDAAATRNSILDAVEEATRRVGEGGTLWFVFIGHGAPSQDGGDGVLVDAVAQQRVLDFYPNTITRTELQATLESGPQASTVVLLDSCFSGRDVSGSVLLHGLQPALLSGTWDAPRSTVMTAAAGDQFAGSLPGANRPAFSYLVLGALHGWGDRDGDLAVTASEAVDYASDVLFETASDRSQTPEIHGVDRDQVLARLKKPSVNQGLDPRESTGTGTATQRTMIAGPDIDFGARARIRTRRTAGGVMLGVGGLVAATGFIVNAATYTAYIDTDDQAQYERAASMAHGGLALGIAGVTTGIAGIVVMVMPSDGERRYALVPGPITLFRVEF